MQLRSLMERIQLKLFNKFLFEKNIFVPTIRVLSPFIFYCLLQKLFPPTAPAFALL